VLGEGRTPEGLRAATAGRLGAVAWPRPVGAVDRLATGAGGKRDRAAVTRQAAAPRGAVPPDLPLPAFLRAEGASIVAIAG
jgi:hypothetical protein